ncbi:MAG: response regulator transcription factor [Candidatus Eisenbacteria bacterium]|nr:response regulator transcription factor [Candidatus Eisenbacteria bacterium]
MNRALRVLVVDDEELARVRIKGLLAEIPDVECVGEAENGIEAVEKARALAPDVMLLDIQMPGKNGFEVLEALDRPPLVIFATAYDEYAIKAFEVNSLDYLQKPIARDRLREAIERARRVLSSDTEIRAEIERLAALVRSRGAGRLPAQKGRRIVLLDLADIVWFEADDELVHAHTRDAKCLVNATMGELEKRLDPSVFFRVHRSTIVNLKRVVEIVPWFGGKYKVVVDDAAQSELVLSRARVKALRALLPW